MICPVGQLVQAPAVQTWPLAHALPAVVAVQSPEAPQKARSVVGSTHLSAQTICPARQVGAHAPAMQIWSAAHALPALVAVQSPEAPQKARSVVGSMHLLPHAIWPSGQLAAHLPSVHTCPAAQVSPVLVPEQSPEAPQWARSVAGSTHLSPHSNCPFRQLAVQTPAAHTCPEAQATPALVPAQSPVAPQ
jgi:hypothetical protein